MGTCKNCGEVFNANDMKDGLCANCIDKPLKVETIKTEKNNEVIITNIKMPFWSMVVFIIKWTMASIPAIIIMALIFTVIIGLLGGMGMMSHRGS
jgi:uncharacterized membrane protein YvbJ